MMMFSAVCVSVAASSGVSAEVLTVRSSANCLGATAGAAAIIRLGRSIVARQYKRGERTLPYAVESVPFFCTAGDLRSLLKK